MEDSKKPLANPGVMLREEFDDWAVLFDPGTGNGFGLNPIGVYLWKLLDGEHSIEEMLRVLRRDAPDVSEEAGEQILAFVEELSEHGLVTYDVKEPHDGRERILARTTGIDENLPYGGGESRRGGMLRYESPRLEPLTLERRAEGACTAGGGCCTGSGDSAQCYTGTGASGDCPGTCCYFTGSNATTSNSSGDACQPGSGAKGGQWVCVATGSSASNRAAGGGATCIAGSSNGTLSGGCSGFGNSAQ